MALPPEPTMTGPYGEPARSPIGAGPDGSATASTRRPSTAGYWIAGLILVVGAVGALIWFVSGISNLFSAVDSYPRFSVPGQITTPLEANRYKVFAEYSGAMTDINGVFRVGDVTVVDSSGRPIPVSSSYTEETYSWGDREGRSIAEFTPPQAGIYTIEVTGATTSSSTTVRVAIGRGLQPESIVPLFAAAALGGVAMLVGIILIVITAVRRGRAKRRDLRVPAFAGYGAPPGYPGYPPGPVGHPGQPGAPGAYGQWGAPPVPPPTGAPVPPPPFVAAPPPIVPPGWGAAPGTPDAAPAPGSAGPPDQQDPELP